MNNPDPFLPQIPDGFNWRYVRRYTGWFLWANALTLFNSLAGTLSTWAAAAMDQKNPPLSANQLAGLVAVAFFINTFIAMRKKNNPPSDVPPKVSSSSNQQENAK
jgi:hypothetical protein